MPEKASPPTPISNSDDATVIIASACYAKLSQLKHFTCMTSFNSQKPSVGDTSITIQQETTV